jgi:hypothetical protein
MEEIINQARELAMKEIDNYGSPTAGHFSIANEKGQQLAETLLADKNIVLLGTILMDLKIGQCKKEGRLPDHVKESSQAAQEFLKQFNLDPEISKKIISCIEQHHGAKEYYCLEAEICANSDCYRFLTPKGFFLALATFSARGLDFNSCLSQADNKVEEKFKVLSLPICRQELELHYLNFKKLMAEAR